MGGYRKTKSKARRVGLMHNAHDRVWIPFYNIFWSSLVPEHLGRELRVLDLSGNVPMLIHDDHMNPVLFEFESQHRLRRNSISTILVQ